MTFYTISLTEIIHADSEAYSEPSQTSKMKVFAKIVSGFEPFTVFTKSSMFGFDWGLNAPLKLDVPSYRIM